VSPNAPTPSLSLGPRRSRALLAVATLVSSASCRRAAAPPAGDGAEIESAGTWAGLRVRTAGERRRPRQVVILLHGWGASGDDLVSLGGVLAAPGRLLVFPEAPLASPGGGRAWWHIDWARLQAARERGEDRDLRQETPVGMAEARAQVTALVGEVTRRARVAPAAVWIGGFSQGAMLATDVALASPAAVAGLVVLSGTPVSEAVWIARMMNMAPHFPVFMSHGRRDPVLPFRAAEALRDDARAAHHDVTWVPFDGGHEIPLVVVSGLGDFLTAHSPAN
jgi:phospholipase/carboxylesterase